MFGHTVYTIGQPNPVNRAETTFPVPYPDDMPPIPTRRPGPCRFHPRAPVPKRLQETRPPGRTTYSSSTRPPVVVSCFSNTLEFFIRTNSRKVIHKQSSFFFIILYKTYIKPSNKSNIFVHFLSWNCILPLLRAISLSRNSVFFILLYISSMVGILSWALHKNMQYLVTNIIWFTTSLRFSL